MRMREGVNDFCVGFSKCVFYHRTKKPANGQMKSKTRLETKHKVGGKNGNYKAHEREPV